MTRLNAAFTLNTYRDLAQDPAFGLQQLVDIAIKALSPGVNDTGTARDALNYITAILAEIVRAPAPRRQVRTSDGRLALVIRCAALNSSYSSRWDRCGATRRATST